MVTSGHPYRIYTLMFNAAQPIRPDYSAEGNPLLYRTQPKKQKRPPKFFSLPQILSAMRLYRAVRKDKVPMQVPIIDLYEYAMKGATDIISKNSMGASVVNSTLYEPRRLVNRKGMKATMTYLFLEIDDLKYGLEWQICAPLYHWFLMNGEWPEDRAVWHNFMDETLNEIANSEHTDYLGLYEKPMIEDNLDLLMKEPDWSLILAKNPERNITNSRSRPNEEPQGEPRDFSRT